MKKLAIVLAGAAVSMAIIGGTSHVVLAATQSETAREFENKKASALFSRAEAFLLFV